MDIDVDDGTLTISAHRTARSEDSVQWLTNERFFGTYRRQLSLGDGIDTSAISATYENGVLTVTIPIAERAKPRKVADRPRRHADVHRADHRRRRLASDVGPVTAPARRRHRSSRNRRLLRTDGHSTSRIE